MADRVLRCSVCGKKLLKYSSASVRKYGNPIRKCKKCGAMYADPRYHEIAIEGIPSSIFSIPAYLFLSALGGFLIYRGIHISGYRQLDMPDFMQWIWPTLLIVGGIVLIIGGIVEIILIKSGRKAKKYEKLQKESEQRLMDKEYAFALQKLGYPVPEKYL